MAANSSAIAQAPPPSSGYLPAVDGINGKVEVLGGSYASKGLYGAGGSIAVPLGGQFGVQLDGGVGAFANRFIGAGGAATCFGAILEKA